MVSMFLVSLLALPFLMALDGASVQTDVMKQLNKHLTKRSDGLLADVVNLLVEDKRQREIILDKFKTMKQVLKEMRTRLNTVVADVITSSREFKDIKNQLDTTKQSVTAHIKESSTRFNDILTKIKAMKSQGLCNNYLVMESAIDAKSLISTSGAHPHCKTKTLYKINSKEGNYGNGEAGGWCSANNKLSSYVQVNFKKEQRVMKVATQGREPHNQYVTKYQVQYSMDCINFSTDGNTYPGNTDDTTVVINTLVKPITGKCFRIYPRGYVKHMSMRFDFIGCSI